MSYTRVPPAEHSKLIGKVVHRNGYDFEWKRKPSHEDVDVVAIYEYGDLYIVFGSFGHQWLVSIQNFTMRTETRLVVFFRCENPETLLSNSIFRRYCRERLRLKSDQLEALVDTIIDLSDRHQP